MNYLRYINQNPEEIIQLFVKTFTDSEGEIEGKRIGELARDLLTKTDKKMIRVFVALDEEKDQLVGCIIFSELSFQDCDINAYLLAPVAVVTDYQGKGIGQNLIAFGQEELKKERVELIMVYGDPNFYAKVGYRFVSEEIISAPHNLSYPSGWLGQSLRHESIRPIDGKSSCVEAINKPEYW